MLPLRDDLVPRRSPVVTYALIAINVLAFVWEASLVSVGYERVVFDWGLVPARFMHAPLEEIPRVFSSMFMHAPENWLHLGGNMLFLWVFGDNVEDALGHAKYALFYLLAGAAAAAAQIGIDPSSVVPMVGASGAIAGVLAAYGSLYPRAPVLVLNPVLPLWLFFGPMFRLPAWVIILEFFVMNLLSGLSTLGQKGGGVAFFAHVGGFVAGLILVRVFFDRRASEREKSWDGWTSPADGRRRDSRDGWQPRPPSRRTPGW